MKGSPPVVSTIVAIAYLRLRVSPSPQSHGRAGFRSPFIENPPEQPNPEMCIDDTQVGTRVVNEQFGC
jgi:hypothetical protein